jgi:polar amino acid transport system substrate-binding protein
MPALRSLAIIAATFVIAGCASTGPSPTAEERRALAPSGTLKLAVVEGIPTMRVVEQLAKAIAAKLGVPLESRSYAGVAAVMKTASSGEWDLGAIIENAERAKLMDFAGRIVEVELSYVLAKDASISDIAAIDRPGVRVAVQERGQGDVLLSRILKSATIVRAPDMNAAIALLKSGKADALAANRPILIDTAEQLPGARLLAGGFAKEAYAAAVPKDRPAAAAYVRRFLNEAKTSGTLDRWMREAGVKGVTAAPPD